MEMLRERGLKIAGKVKKVTGIKTGVAVTSSGEIIFNCYCLDNSYDYAIITIANGLNKSDLEIIKEIYCKTESGDYYIYHATELEKKLINYIEENKIKNAWIYEGELNIQADGYTLDPIDLKYYSYYNLEINDRRLELTIKYEDEYEIFIEHIFDELYVTEFNQDAEECCIYCHEVDCDCLESNLEKDDKCYCAELSESLMCANQEIEELKEVIEKQGQLIEELKNALAISEYLRKC